MILLGIDPGANHLGMVVYDTTTQRVLWTAGDAQPEAWDSRLVEDYLRERKLAFITGRHFSLDAVIIERVKGQGRVVGGSTLQTAEWVGEIRRRCKDAGPRTLFVARYRYEVVRSLDCGGKGNKDALVKARLVEMHGCSTLRQAKGTPKNPGPLFGVANHAWAALAVAYSWALETGQV